MKHHLKEGSEKIIMQLAVWNNDIKEYSKMYSGVWVLLVGFGLWSSFNAAKADFSVLYGNYYNLHQNADKAWYYGFFLAFFIQCLILIPAGVIAKIVINKLFSGTENKRHRFQLYYLAPILLAGLTWSTFLSLNIGQAVRAESDLDYQATLGEMESKLNEKETAVASIQNEQQTKFSKDSTLLAQKYKARRIAKRTEIYTKIDSLKRLATRWEKHYNKTGAAWARASARNLKTKNIPTLQAQYEQYFNNNQAQLLNELDLLKHRTDTLFAPKFNQYEATYASITDRLDKRLTQLDADVKYSTEKRRAMSIMFNCLSLLITFGVREVYKNINEDKNSTQVGKVVHQKVEQVDKTVETQESQSSSGSDAVLLKADIDRAKRLITGTYYDRCFTKDAIGSKGSKAEATALKNRAKVKELIQQLQEWGVRTEISFEEYKKPTFHV